MRRAALAAVAGTALLIGCGGNGADGGKSGANAASDGQGSPAQGRELTTTLPEATGDLDVLTWALPMGEPRTIDPSLGADFSPSFVSAQLCDTLQRLNDDFTISPNLAVADQRDPRTLVYKLREGVKFWDGSEMTSEDVVYSLKRSSRPEAVTAASFSSVRSIEATGRYEVTVHFARPDELFNKGMANFGGMIVEKDVSEEAGDKLGTPGGSMMCSGPFELVSWKPGSSIELRRNDDYWNPEFRAHAATVKLRFLSDSSALTQALLAGEVDGAYEVPLATIPALSRGGGGKLYFGPSLQSVLLMPARSEGPLSDADVRKALFGSIDRAGLADVVFHGAAEPAYTLLAPNNWDPEARPQWEAAYGEFERANQLSVEDAKALVVGSGASAPIVVAVIAGDATMSQAAQLIQQSAKEIGLEVRIEALPPAKFSEAFFNEGARKDIDALLTSSFGATSDPVEQIEFLAMTGGFYNYVGYSNPRVDALLKRARRSFDPAERTTLLVEAQSIYEAESLATTVLTQNEVLYLRHGLTGATASFAYLFQPSLARVGADG